MNILNLRDWNVLSLAEAEHDYRITAEYLVEPKFCQKCGCFTDSSADARQVGMGDYHPARATAHLGGGVEELSIAIGE